MNEFKLIINMQLLTSQLINKIICSLGRFYFLPAWRIHERAVLVCVCLCMSFCMCLCVCLHVYFSSCAAKSCQCSFSFCVMQRQQLPREWAKKKCMARALPTLPYRLKRSCPTSVVNLACWGLSGVNQTVAWLAAWLIVKVISDFIFQMVAHTKCRRSRLRKGRSHAPIVSYCIRQRRHFVKASTVFLTFFLRSVSVFASIRIFCTLASPSPVSVPVVECFVHFNLCNYLNDFGNYETASC